MISKLFMYTFCIWMFKILFTWGISYLLERFVLFFITFNSFPISAVEWIMKMSLLIHSTAFCDQKYVAGIYTKLFTHLPIIFRAIDEFMQCKKIREELPYTFVDAYALDLKEGSRNTSNMILYSFFKACSNIYVIIWSSYSYFLVEIWT